MAQRGERATVGSWQTATVPDTLDLVDRAELAINALTGKIDPKLDHEVSWTYQFAPPAIYHHAGEWFDIPRTLEALALFRVMTGSTHNLDLERGLYESIVAHTAPDGFLYSAAYRDDAPWRRGGAQYCREPLKRLDEPVTEIHTPAELLVALLARHQVSGDPAELQWAEKLARGLCRIAIRKDDYAYYPATSAVGLEFAYFRDTGWPDTQEAVDEADSAEGTVLCYIGIALRALARWYGASGDPEALDTAARLTRYMLKPRFWLGSVESWSNDGVWSSCGHGGAQRKPAALFRGHLAGLAYAFHGLIEYAIQTNDDYVKQFVRQGYEYMRNLGLVRVGMYGENIANNVMAVLAAKLCEAGVGDYWEDVDEHLRNTVVEDQYVDAELMREECRRRGVPSSLGDLSVERFLGSLRHIGVIDRNGTLDPTQNGVLSSHYLEPFYYLWEAITRCQNGAAQVNLLLNRVSPWLDIESHLPYEGKVVVRNKAAHLVSVRIPRWADRRRVVCRVGDEVQAPAWAGNYLAFAGLQGAEVITIEFPIVQSVERYTLTGFSGDALWYRRQQELPQYILHMKGNTCVRVEFPNRDAFEKPPLALGYPVYQRAHYLADRAPQRNVRRLVSATVPAW